MGVGVDDLFGQSYNKEGKTKKYLHWLGESVHLDMQAKALHCVGLLKARYTGRFKKQNLKRPCHLYHSEAQSF